MRKYVKELWNIKYSSSDIRSGDCLFKEISDEMKCIKDKDDEIKRIKMGSEQHWTISTLSFVILDADLKLIEECRSKDERIHPLLIREEIQTLRDIDRSISEHKQNMYCSSVQFGRLAARIQKASRIIFGIDAEFEIGKIIKSHMSRINEIRIKVLLDLETSGIIEPIQLDEEKGNSLTYNHPA